MSGAAGKEEHCANCNAACDKPLRCSICKAASYCNAKCQKEDWRFHKRNCKKPKLEAETPIRDPDEEKRVQETFEKEMADKDPKMAEQVKAMMAGMLPSEKKTGGTISP